MQMNAIPDTSAWYQNLPKGLLVAGEFAWLAKNRNYRADGTVPGFIVFGGFSAGATGFPYLGFVYELARRGYPLICGDIGDSPTTMTSLDGPGAWGNDASRAKVDTYRTYLQGALGAKAGPVGLLYGSHGCSGAYSWARAHSTDVLCIAGAIGTADVEEIRANNMGGGGGYQASIESRYTNNAGWQASRATHNPVEVAAYLSAAGIPQLDYYSTTDPVCSLTSHQLLHTNAGAQMTAISMGAIGHSLPGLGLPNLPAGDSRNADFADWVEAQLEAA